MNDQQQNNNDEYVSVSLEYGPGQTLADGREAKGLTVADVAVQLNVTEAIVNGLERDDYNNLPPAIYTRGYLRNYANLLQIDPEPLLVRQKQLTSTGDDETIVKPAAIHAESSGRIIKKKQFKRKKDRSLSLFIILLVLMMVGIGYGIYHLISNGSVNYPSSSAIEQENSQQQDSTSNLQDQDSISIPNESESIRLSISDSTQPDNEDELEVIEENEQSQTLSIPLPNGSEEQNSEEVINDLDETDTENQPSANTETEIEAVIPVKEEFVTESRERQVSDTADIKVLVADDSYIEIIDAAGKRFFFRVLSAGTIKEINGKKPFKVVLGNAGAVKLEYNGQPYDFGEYGLGKVARFSLQ